MHTVGICLIGLLILIVLGLLFRIILKIALWIIIIILLLILIGGGITYFTKFFGGIIIPFIGAFLV